VRILDHRTPTGDPDEPVPGALRSPDGGCRRPRSGTRVRTWTPKRLSKTFVELADTLVADFDVLDFLHLLTTRCTQLLDVTAAGVLLADAAGELRVMAASSEQVRLLELFQLQNDQGPCLHCYRSGRPVNVNDLSTVELRWPRSNRPGPPARIQRGVCPGDERHLRLDELSCRTRVCEPWWVPMHPPQHQRQALVRRGTHPSARTPSPPR
jgi:hypothetical protein